MAPAGTTPQSPFARADRAAKRCQRKSEAQAASTVRAIKQEEVAAMDQFYSALRGLVEKQRISDPLSLFIVHKVRWRPAPPAACCAHA